MLVTPMIGRACPVPRFCSELATRDDKFKHQYPVFQATFQN